MVSHGDMHTKPGCGQLGAFFEKGSELRVELPTVSDREAYRDPGTRTSHYPAHETQTGAAVASGRSVD